MPDPLRSLRAKYAHSRRMITACEIMIEDLRGLVRGLREENTSARAELVKARDEIKLYKAAVENQESTAAQARSQIAAQAERIRQDNIQFDEFKNRCQKEIDVLKRRCIDSESARKHVAKAEAERNEAHEEIARLKAGRPETSIVLGNGHVDRDFFSFLKQHGGKLTIEFSGSG